MVPADKEQSSLFTPPHFFPPANQSKMPFSNKQTNKKKIIPRYFR